MLEQLLQNLAPVLLALSTLLGTVVFYQTKLRKMKHDVAYKEYKSFTEINKEYMNTVKDLSNEIGELRQKLSDKDTYIHKLEEQIKQEVADRKELEKHVEELETRLKKLEKK